MASLYEELARRLKDDPAPRRTGGARYDISVLLFNSRDALNELWKAADRYLRSSDDESLADLGTAVEALRPLYGDAPRQPTST